MRIRTILLLAATSLALAGPAQAVTIDYTTGSSGLDHYFAGTDHEIYGAFTGNVATDGWLRVNTPAGIILFHPISTSVTLTEGNSVIQPINIYLRAPEDGFVHPDPVGVGPSENIAIAFLFTIGSNSVAVAYNHDLEIVANPVYASEFRLETANVVSFDLGAEGILDVTFLTPPRLNSGPSFDPHGISFNAMFLLRDVPARIPEPGTLMLMGAGLIGLGFARRRRAV